MAFQLPTAAELKALAGSHGFTIDDSYAATLLQFMGPFGEGYHLLDAEPDELPPVAYRNRSYHVPTDGDNSLGAWYVTTKLAGAASGPLHGYTVAIKDNIFIADVPMMNGANVLEGFIPDFDATVVTRLLDAGAEITGKSVCEYFCTSSASITGNNRVVRNPRKLEHTTGGSSSGSAALVADGQVRLALGSDQAGSVRIPSSFCGIYGMKPTHGLVPYTGAMGMEASVDNLGPLTTTVHDNALALEVLAGYDDYDGRQRRLQVHKYTEALGRGVAGLKIGVVAEGFGMPYADPEVDACVRAAAAQFEGLGATVQSVSIPEHLQGIAIWGGVVTDGLWQTVKSNGIISNVGGAYSPALWQAAEGWLNRLEEMPHNVRLILLFGAWLEQYHGKYYGKAKNLARRLTAAYDQALAKFDLLLMPTTPTTAPRNPDSVAEATVADVIGQAFNSLFNTCPFNVTGHPAMSIPCGLREDLPVGLMLIGKQFDEPTIYRAAEAFEQNTNWQED